MINVYEKCTIFMKILDIKQVLIIVFEKSIHGLKMLKCTNMFLAYSKNIDIKNFI